MKMSKLFRGKCFCALIFKIWGSNPIFGVSVGSAFRGSAYSAPSPRGSPRVEASAVGWDVSAPLPPWQWGSPAPLLTRQCQRSPRSTGCWAPSCTARACRPGRAKSGESKVLSPSLPAPPLHPAHSRLRAPLTGTKLSFCRRTMSPTQMSRHFCQRKLQENEGGEFSSSQSRGNRIHGCSCPPDQLQSTPLLA